MEHSQETLQPVYSALHKIKGYICLYCDQQNWMRQLSIYSAYVARHDIEQVDTVILITSITPTLTKVTAMRQ